MNDILNFKGHSIQVYLNDEKQDFSSPVKSLEIVNSFYRKAILENNSETWFLFKEPTDGVPFFNCTLDYKGSECKIKLQDKEFPNSEVTSISFCVENDFTHIAYFENGEAVEFEFFSYEDSIHFRDDVNVEKYQNAVDALTKIKTAINEYRLTMAALGAIQKEEGDLDYQECWLEIPEIPDYKWPEF